MCGIQLFLDINPSESNLEYGLIKDKIKQANHKRGPDLNDSMRKTIKLNDNFSIDLEFAANVLCLRGEPTRQPFICEETGDILCWNGEIFGGLEHDTVVLIETKYRRIMDDYQASTVSNEQNDGRCLFDKIRSESDNGKGLLDIIKEIRGPYAFIYYNEDEKSVYFGRDCLGRRSLMIHVSEDQTKVILSSTGFEGNSSVFWKELDAPRIYCLKLSALLDDHDTVYSRIECISWVYPENIDCNEKKMILPFRRVSTIEINGEPEQDYENIRDIEEYVTSSEMKSYIDKLHTCLSNAVRVRTETSLHSGFGVLFSGGLDCTVLAAMMDSFLPKHEPIELLNVAFANPRILDLNHGKGVSKKPSSKASKPNQQETYNVPDRKTGFVGLHELRSKFPDREWRWVQIDVPYDEVLTHRKTIIDLLGPNYTVMDLSIAMALWFAARGEGVMENGTEKVENYKAKAKVLILGMGADEQFGGYSRHRESYKQGGLSTLVKEIKFDVERISSRNLGRDDRIISSHGREARFPYLDENVVDFVSSIPIEYKMDMRLPRGIGEKLLLRLLARNLGLTNTSTQPKRAIQFGARTAKMETGRDKGNDSL